MTAVTIDLAFFFLFFFFFFGGGGVGGGGKIWDTTEMPGNRALQYQAKHLINERKI